jgi:hypothetical protein
VPAIPTLVGTLTNFRSVCRVVNAAFFFAMAGYHSHAPLGLSGPPPGGSTPVCILTPFQG